ncbi:MAG: ATP-binding cassette, subfamily bacterial [Acidobacteriota bacterium]
MKTKFRNIITRNLAAEKWNFVVAIACTLIVSVADLLRPWPLKLIVDNILLGKTLPPSLRSLENFFTTQKVWTTVAVASVLIVLSAVKGFSVYAQTSITSRIGYRIAHALRRELFSHLQRLSLAFHKRSRSGELLTKVTSDTNSVRDAFSEFALTLVTETLTLVGMIVVMFAMNVELSLVVLSTFPILTIISVYRFRRIRDSARKVRKAEGNLAARVSETLHAIALVKAFGRERYETERFESESSETLNESIRTARLEAASSRAADIVNAVGTFAVLVFGSLQALRGHITPGSLLVFVAYMNSLYVPIRTLAKLSAKLSRAFVSAGRISETLGIEPEREDSPGAIEATAIRGDISFRHVNFEYGAGKPVLRNISFDIATGEKIALLGRSGAGKSTIISLLLRLYEIEDGAILIDGINVKDYKRESLRQQIAIVMQDSVMFGASVRENIAYGKVDATDEEIIRAAKAANAHEFISKLEDGYDTVIGERGGTLSGGQRQRIAIARAFVRSAPILVLDEPMTGLDVESEAAVREALNRLMRGKTCLAITHDLAAAATADRVLILENGRMHRAVRGSAGSTSKTRAIAEVHPALPRSVLLGA